ncbi:hypothetical protein E3J79_01015 [Candidatus Dependentiae bacterium]|nr:MAG: hypothetical protein E3J79_01015 [Candidatus Dependentiae bacterium]
MNHKKVIIMFILLGCVSSTSIGKIGYFGCTLGYGNSNPSPTTIAKVLTGGIAVVATSYCLYRFCSWLFGQSDEKLLEKANGAYNNAYARYNIMYSTIKNAFPVYSSNSDIIYNFSEPVLYQLAVEKHYEASIGIYLRHLNSTIKNLEYYKRKLAQKVSFLHTTVYTDSSKALLYDHIHALLQKIKTILPSLSLLHDYLRHNKSYFTLFELESSLLYRYNQELNVLNTYSCSHDQSYLKEALHQCVMMHHSHNQSRYPYLTYVDMISKDIDTLYNTIRRLAFNYAERINYAQDLYNRLGAIKGIAVSTNQYHTELIEREKVQLQETELAIQQQQLHAMQQQNYLHAQELLLQQQQQNNRPYRM